MKNSKIKKTSTILQHISHFEQEANKFKVLFYNRNQNFSVSLVYQDLLFPSQFKLFQHVLIFNFVFCLFPDFISA